MPSSNHNFVWYELLTTDTGAAESFYSGVFGWRVTDSGLTDRRYSILSAGEVPVGGLMALPRHLADAGGRPGWMGYVGVGSVDDHAARLRQSGGAIHRAPEDIPGVGRFAIVSDPQGANFALFQGPPGQQPPAVAPGTAGHVGWNELYAANWQEAFSFYTGLFGWTKDQAVDMGPMGVYQLFAAGGPAIGGMMNKPKESPRPAWLFYWNVEAIDAAAARVTDKGGKILNGPMQVPGGTWIVQCSDPQGALFAMAAAHR
jgi:predicted enzyme related to lactoylglutathione lyase